MITLSRLPHVALAAANAAWTATGGNKLGLAATLAPGLDADALGRALVKVGALAPAEALYIETTSATRRPWSEAPTPLVVALETFRATWWSLLPLISAEDAATAARAADAARGRDPGDRTFAERSSGMMDRVEF